MTQRRLAQAVGLSDAQVSRLLRGLCQASTIVIETVLRLSDGQVTADDWHRVRLAAGTGSGRGQRNRPPAGGAGGHSESRAA